MGSIRRKALPLGATRFIIIAILVPLLVAAGCTGRKTAQEALKQGNACRDKEDFEAAIAAYTEAIRLKPGQTPADLLAQGDNFLAAQSAAENPHVAYLAVE